MYYTRNNLPIFIAQLILCMACGHNTSTGQHHDHEDANAFMNSRPIEDLVAAFESPERAEWQKPDKVIESLGDLPR